MLRKFTEIKNLRLAALDGEIGRIKELYFDDHSWTVRYLAVDTGGWLIGREVLIPPSSLGTLDEERKTVAVSLTREQVENSPPVEADKPLSRQFEDEWHRYYGFPIYWAEPMPWPVGAIQLSPEAVVAADAAEREPAPQGDPHLRSTGEVIGYAIHATDGDLGHVDDFALEETSWAIRYIIISRSWWSGKRVMIAPEWIEEVSWEQMKVLVPVTRETIRDAPELKAGEPITRAYEERLYDYYGRRRYWPIEV